MLFAISKIGYLFIGVGEKFLMNYGLERPLQLNILGFGCKVYILNTKNHLEFFLAKVDEANLVGYSLTSRAYKAYKRRTLKVEESFSIVFDESSKQSMEP